MKNILLLFLLLTNIATAQSDIALLNINSNLNTSNLSSTFEKSLNNFELINGMIIIKAKVNGQFGNFILDTGAPGIILNQKPQKVSTEYTAEGISGAIEIGEINIQNFEWGAIQLSNLQGFNIDISHLEHTLELPLNGLIGFDIIKNYELLFDYQNKQIEILNPKQNYLHQSQKPSVQLPFSMQGHLPIVKAKIDNQKINFGIDTGATINLLDGNLKGKINPNLLSNFEIEELRGLDKQLKKYQSADLAETQIKNTNLQEMRFLFSDMSIVNENNDFQIDGLLGFPFFAKHKVSINYKKQKIYIW